MNRAICHFSLLVVLLAVVPGAMQAAEADQQYRNPVVFCRVEHDEATGKVVAPCKLWVMEEDGSGLRQLLFGAARGDHPSIYDDRRHVLYAEHATPRPEGDVSSKLIKVDIYSGKKETLVETDKDCNLNHPSLSPIGEIPAYHMSCVDPERQSQWVGLGDSAYEVSTVAHNGVALPDGIVFMHEKNRGYSPREVSIARMFGHGSGARMVLLTDDDALHRRPAISPDGQWMAWQTNIAGGEDEIFLARVDGSDRRNLTNAAGNDGHPWFSKDGKKIVFESDRSGNWEIWILEVETLAAKQLTSGGKKYTSTRPRM